MRAAIPGWMTSPGVISGTFAGAVADGAKWLVAASLRSGAAQRAQQVNATGRTRVSEEAFQGRLCRLPIRLEMGIHGMQHSWGNFARGLGQALLSEPVLAAHGRVALSAGIAAEALDAVRRRLEVVVCRARGAVHLSAFAPTPPETSPFWLIQAAYTVLKGNRETVRPQGSDVDAMLCLGLAGRALLEMKACEFCFRWAVPGHSHCVEHSLSKVVGGTAQQRQSRYAAGRRVAGQYYSTFHQVPSRLNRITRAERPFLIARLLWGVSLPDEERTLRATERALVQRSEAAARGRGEAWQAVPRSGLFDALRVRLDPFEHHPAAWVPKLRAAQAWYAAAAVMTPGQRGRSLKVRSRLPDALWHANRGATKGQVASLLGISPATLTYMLKCDFGKELAAAFASPRSATVPTAADLARRELATRRQDRLDSGLAVADDP